MNLDPHAGLEEPLRAGVRTALAYLNGRSRHRFTALYRFDGATLRNLYFYDRLNPDVEESDDHPVEATYCVFVRDTGRPFVVSDAFCDARVNGHPAQDRVQAYCGVPLADHDGRVFGTVCHFDYVPVPATEGEVELMEALAPLLAKQCDY